MRQTCSILAHGWVQIDPENEQLLQQHLACAAAEIPLLLQDDQAYFGARLPEVASFLQSVGAHHALPHGFLSHASL